MSQQLLTIPFNEQAGASVAINTANAARSAMVVGGQFGQQAGRSGLHLSAGGYAEVSGTPPFSLESSFTFTGYVKADVTGNPTNTYLLLRFPGTDRYLSKALGTPMTSWTKIRLQQQVSDGVGMLVIALNDVVFDTSDYPVGWGLPTGMALYNDDVTTAVGNVSWSEVNVESDVIIRAQLIGPVSYELVTVDTPAPVALPGRVTYSINGKPFSQFGVTVEKSAGIKDRLALKPPSTYDWPDQHGEVVDLTTLRYQPRTITLACWMKAASSALLLQQWDNLLAELGKPLTQRLQINVFDNKPLVYEVYAVDAIELDKKWREGQMIARFSLVLREPAPIKRVLSVSGPGSVQLQLTTNSALDIHWGDGTHDYDVYGSSLSLSHTYAGTGTYYVLISGALEEIVSLTHNATLVWNLL